MEEAPHKVLHFSFQDVEFDFRIDQTEQVISQNVINTGGWEQNQLSLYRSFIPDGGLMIDVGANVGINSIFAKRIVPTAEVHAIEASAANFALLKHNASDTGISVHHLAIAGHDGTIKFGGSGTHAKISEYGVDVDCMTLDAFARDFSRVDLIKIDVEGFTDVVLSGARYILGKAERTIVEFSIGDVENRFKGSVPVLDHFDDLFKRFRFLNAYYISRRDGLVALDNASDLIEVLGVENGVGDMLFSRHKERAISLSGLMFRKISALQHANHSLVTEYRRLAAKVDASN